MVHFLGFHAHYTIEFDKDLLNETCRDPKYIVQASCKKERGERGNRINLKFAQEIKRKLIVFFISRS
jgi:hypothetical protein